MQTALSLSDTNTSSDDASKSKSMPQQQFLFLFLFYVRPFLSVGLALLDWVFDSLESLKSWVLIRALRWGSEHGMAWHDGSF